MTNRYDLSKLSSKDLLSGLEALVARDQQLTSELLAVVAEMDDRELELDDACPDCMSLAEHLRERGLGGAAPEAGEEADPEAHA